MTRYIRRAFLLASAAAITAASAVTGLVTAAGTASAADTAQCAAAVTAPHGNPANQWCAGQKLATLGLGLAVPNKVAAYAQATVKPWSATNGSEDFAIYPPSAGAAPVKVFEYAPRGVMSGLCLAVNNKHTQVVLKSCNVGSPGQQWQPGSSSADGGNSWDSVATGQAITAPGGAYSRLILSADSGTTHQGFTYEQ